MAAILHDWLDSWSGLALTIAGMTYQGWDVQLTAYAARDWRANFFPVGSRTPRRRLGVGADAVAGGAAGGVGSCYTDRVLSPRRPPYPTWKFYPSRMAPPPWVFEFIGVVAAARPLIDTAQVTGLTSNKVLESLRPGLERLNYKVEDRGTRTKLYRPVLFGDEGAAQVAYNVDAVVSAHVSAMSVPPPR
jgi:hypothetical protein